MSYPDYSGGPPDDLIDDLYKKQEETDRLRTENAQLHGKYGDLLLNNRDLKESLEANKAVAVSLQKRIKELEEGLRKSQAYVAGYKVGSEKELTWFSNLLKGQG